MTTLLQCPNCFAPLPPPGSGHTTCRFCGATSLTKGSRTTADQPPPRLPPDPLGAKALAIDFKSQHGVDVTKDGQAMQRLGEAWAKATIELQHTERTTVNLPFLTATKNGPIHYERELDKAWVMMLLAKARK